MAKIISFINYKGGVGKTTTTFHIGCALAMFEPKKKVLLIDADPQTNLTFLCCDMARWASPNTRRLLKMVPSLRSRRVAYECEIFRLKQADRLENMWEEISKPLLMVGHSCAVPIM